MLQEFINKQFYRIFLITLFFGVLLSGLIGFQSIDELCGAFLFLLFIFHMFHSKNWEINKFFLVVLGIFLFYLFYSIQIHSNSVKGILMDFIIQLKPYLAFFCTYQLAPIFSSKSKKILSDSSIVGWVLLLPIGVLGIINPNTFKVTMAHASNYAAAITALAIVFLYSSDYSKRNILTFIILLAAGIASGRSKFYGFFIMATFLITYLTKPERIKINFKNTILFLVTITIMAVVAKSKIELYFLQGLSDNADKDYVARFVLYATSFQVFYDYFPLGCGFASFATFASGAYYSHIYKEYEIDGIWGISKSYHSFISDTYYPSLAQFGIVGIVLFILFWIYLIKKSLLYANVTRDMKLTVISILIIVFFAIENIADATFTSNRGLFFMMMLGLIYSDMNKAIKTNNTRSLNGLQQTFP